MPDACGLAVACMLARSGIEPRRARALVPRPARGRSGSSRGQRGNPCRVFSLDRNAGPSRANSFFCRAAVDFRRCLRKRG